MRLEKICEMVIVKNKNTALLKTEEAQQAWAEFAHNNNEVVVKVDHNFNDFMDVFHVYETDDYYVALVAEEYWCLGTEDADGFVSNPKNGLKLLIEPKEWACEEISLRHWEDGIMEFTIYPIEKNRVKYLLGLRPEGAVSLWKEQEYRDFGNHYDDHIFDKMWYK